MGLDIWFEKRRNIKYFRKVNFLVKYFMDEGMDVENQIPFEVTRKQAEQLLTRCELVLKNNLTAPIFLPTMSGFFFGSTEYDENYFKNVEEVRDYLENTLLPMFDILNKDESIYFVIWY